MISTHAFDVRYQRDALGTLSCIVETAANDRITGSVILFGGAEVRLPSSSSRPIRAALFVVSSRLGQVEWFREVIERAAFRRLLTAVFKFRVR